MLLLPVATQCQSQCGAVLCCVLFSFLTRLPRYAVLQSTAKSCEVAQRGGRLDKAHPWSSLLPLPSCLAAQAAFSAIPNNACAVSSGAISLGQLPQDNFSHFTYSSPRIAIPA